MTFPSGVVRKEPGFDNVCASCHRGREAKATVDAAIAAGKPAFKNVHYLPAAAVKLGSAAHVGYEYDGKTYVGPLSHVGGTQCTSCHNPAGSHHTFQVADGWDRTCRGCHADANGDPKKIRLIRTVDYDGDGNTAETLAAEIDGIAAATLAAMQAVAPAPGLCYAPRDVSLLLQGHATATRAAAPPSRCRRTASRRGPPGCPRRRSTISCPAPSPARGRTTSTTWPSSSTTARRIWVAT